MVPDGVARVTVLVPKRNGAKALTSVTGTVHNNVGAIIVPGAPDDPVQNMIWYGPGGNVSGGGHAWVRSVNIFRLQPSSGGAQPSDPGASKPSTA